MVWKSLPTNTLLFDIETGGLSGYRSSVLSIAYQDILGKGEELFAAPEEGTHISQWSKNKVWSRIEKDSIRKAIRIQQEHEILSRFLNVLEKHAETPGATIAGWNIGYQALPQNPDDPRLRGFDISMLMTRAERHGLAGRYEKALSRLQVRDLGQEWASRIAEIVSKPQYEGRVDPKLYESAKGYQKALYSEGMEGASYEARARWASTSGTKVAGWTQELTHFLKTGQTYEAHGAMEDVGALREMLSYNTIENEEEFVERWNRAALTDKLVKQARSTTKGTTLQEIQDYARKAGLQVEGKGGLTEKIEELAKASGASLEDIAMGRGMPERWSKVVGRVSAARPAASSFGRIAEGVVSHIGQHKVGYGIAVGAAALYAIGPLSLFSGKDDAHNTIEGMQHGGMAERLRQAMTDFGSGYQGITNTIRRWYAQKDEEEREKNRETVKKNAPTPRAQHAQVHAKRGKSYWITRTTTRPNRISGKDDDYNTITGMPEKGLAGKTRKHRTDFGSGYQGPNPWLQPDYNEKQEVAHYKLMRASQLGKSVSEMVAYFTTKENPSEYLLSTASAGTALHLVEQTKKAASGEAESVEQLVYDPLYKITGHIDLTRADSGAPVDIKSLAPERMERIRTKGAFPKHVSQLNFYMAMLGQDKGYLEYINRQNVDDRQIIEVPFSQSKLDEDLARLTRAREIVEEGIASGKWKEDELPKGASLETLRAQAEEEKGTLAKNAGRLDYLENVYSEEMEYFHKLDAERRKAGRKAVSYPSRFSGKDDNYNTIEGLKHGGFAEQMRREMTDFGSGWIVPAMMILDDAVPAYLRTPSGQALMLDVKNEFSGKDDEYNSIEGMPHGWFGKWRKRSTDFGSGFLRFLSPSFWKSVRTGLRESPVYTELAAQSDNFFWKVDPRDYEDVLEHTDIPSRIRYLFNPRNPQRLLGPSEIRESSIAKFRQLLGRNNPTLLANRPTVRLVKEGIGPISNEDIMFGNTRQEMLGSYLPDRPTAILRSSSGKQLTNREIMASSQSYLTRRQDVSISQWAELTKGAGQQGMASEFKVLSEGQIQSPGNVATDGVIPKIQESYNDFTGMPHTSAQTVAERKKHGFKSKWDMLAKKFGLETLEGAEFQSALSMAKVGDKLGSGVSGSVFKMTSEFRGEQFEFARKIGHITPTEVEIQKAFSGDFAPTVYRSSESQGTQYVDMELFRGQTLEQSMKGKGYSHEAVFTAAQKVEANINKSISGYRAADVNMKNIMIIPKEGGGHNVGIIDYGWWEKEGGSYVDLDFSDFDTVSEGVVKHAAPETLPIPQMKTPVEDRATLQRDATATLFNNARAGHGHNTGKKF